MKLICHQSRKTRVKKQNISFFLFFRSAPPAILKVLAPPTIVRGPQDSEVIEGEGLDMPCEVNKLVY